jgi:hypothetical protein
MYSRCSLPAIKAVSLGKVVYFPERSVPPVARGARVLQPECHMALERTVAHVRSREAGFVPGSGDRRGSYQPMVGSDSNSHA